MTQSTRLNQLQIETIKNIIYNYFGECEIYLFGSQTNLKKGVVILIYLLFVIKK